MINIQPISNVVGVLLILIGIVMLGCLPFSFYYGSEDVYALTISGFITIGVGIAAWSFRFSSETQVNKREGYLIVTLGWISMTLAGVLPYMISGVIPTFAEAFFESVSGFTTTGASVLQNIEATPKGILFFRSITQWIGGMGIIVLTVALFPMLGIGGIELFSAEAPGPTSNKIHPRIKETAKRLWFIYFGLTVLLCVIFWCVGMNFYDAINHALTTMATGGFSTKNASMAFFPPHIQYITIFFMFLAGVNYTVIYLGLTGKFKRVWANEEFRAYLLVVLVLTVIVGGTIVSVLDIKAEQAFRDALFQVVSLITTTGFVSADYTQWTSSIMIICFALLFIGACAGSTSGGIKLIRHLVFFKNTLLEFQRILHPRAIIRLKINKQIVSARILTHILVFLLVYIATFVIGTFVVTALGMDMISAASAAATALGNVGPGLGSVGPVNNFADVPSTAKVVLSFLMLLGRLELFSILVLFTPYFWKLN
jgi:trk system potassium uptake protein TrkH